MKLKITNIIISKQQKEIKTSPAVKPFKINGVPLAVVEQVCPEN